MNRIMVGVAALGLFLAGCGAQAKIVHSVPPSRVSWVPTLSAVAHVRLDLNSSPTDPTLQGPGPFEISSSTATSRTVVSKLLGWLRQAKPLPMTPIPLPSLGDHMLTVALRNGKTVSVAQYFVQDGSGNFQASPTVVLISTPLAASNSVRYRDPALAHWLNAGWSTDLEKLAPHWKCTNRRPPSPYENEIHGAFSNGTQWVVAADAAQGCAVLYTTKGKGWKATLIAMPVFSSPSSGARVEQVQFIDSVHGFVLISGSPHMGQVPRVLFVTLDGGAYWHAMPVDAEQPFPRSDTTVIMRFTSFRVGWLVTRNKGRVYVYHTTSGGETWTNTSFSLSARAASDPSLIALPPTFQNAEEGTIEVVSQWGGLLFFNTSDAGQHWIFDPLGNG